jgi:hypothetical protein
LLHEVAEEGFRMLRATLMDAWGKGGRRGFDEMGRAYVQFAVDHPSHYRVMFGGGERHEASLEGADEGGAAFQVLVDAIVSEHAAGRLRRDDPHQLALHIWALVHGIALLALDGLLPPETSPEALAAFSIARLHGGIDAPGAR